MTNAVQTSADLERIAALPRRVWRPEQTSAIVSGLTAALRTPNGAQTLQDHQAHALAEIAAFGGGAYLPLPVGTGKTLISLLAPRMLPHVRRPLILTRANLVGKTITEEQGYRADWVLPVIRRIESYETIARVGAANFFRDYQPDLVILDEAHAAKNRQASTTRRIWRYLHARECATCAASKAPCPPHHPKGIDVPLIVLTGSPIGTSIRDTAHLVARALRNRSPLPHAYDAVVEWAGALDVGLQPARVFEPGALARFIGPEDGGDHRAAVCRRIIETPGVVTKRGAVVSIPIVVRSHVVDHDDAQTSAMLRLRDIGERPDGELAEDSMAIWRHAREISLGFYSVWEPRPPREWVERRRAWHAICRDVLETNRRDLDSAEQLARHLATHPEHYPEAAEAWRSWKEIEPIYRKSVVARWISDRTIEWVGKWIASSDAPGLIWTDRPIFGERIRAKLGIPYYGEEGIDPVSGRYIGTETRTCATSARAGSTGHNLQAFSRNLCLSIPRSPIEWEQRIGRTHRPGQKAERIDVDLLFGVREDVAAFAAAQEFAANVESLTGSDQKLSSADCTQVLAPEDILGRTEPRWRRAKSRSPESSSFFADR